MDEKQLLKSKLATLSLSLQNLTRSYNELVRLKNSMHESIIVLKAEYESTDRRLAEIDGRLTVIEKGQQKEKKQVRLQLSDLMEIAKELNIDLNGKGGEEEDE